MVESSKGPGALYDGTFLPVHPRTGLTAVGIVGGKPVWPIKGASPDHEGEPSGQAPQGDQQPATPPAPPSGQEPDKKPSDKTDLKTLPPDVQAYIDRLQNEAAKHRSDKQTATTAAQAAAQQRDAVLRALGLTSDGKDAPPDAEALAAQVTQLQAVAWENGAQAAIVRVAGKAGADADALLDSNSFLDSLEEFVSEDPTSADFRTKMQAHIKAFVEEHPKFKTAPAGPARSGGDHPGGAGSSSKRPTSLTAAVSKHFGGK